MAVGEAWCVLFVLLGLWKGSVSLQWTSSRDLPDGVTFPACFQHDVTLAWDYISAANEHIVNTEWRFVPQGSSAEMTLATEVYGHFFADQSSGQHVQFVPKAGLRLPKVTAADMGTYSVHVHLSQNGASRTYVQTVKLVVTDTSITAGDVLEAKFMGASYVKATREHHLMLTCGTVKPLWLPKVQIVWTTPDNQTLPSSFQQNGVYTLAVPNPFLEGPYTCTVDNSSAASFCIASDSLLLAGGNVTVDAVEGQLSLLGSQMASMKTQLAGLQNSTGEMTGQAQTLLANYTDLGQQIQTLKEHNAHLELQLPSPAPDASL